MHAIGSADLSRHDFVSSPVRTTAGHAYTFDETEDLITPVLVKVPITRVFDATPLDVLGLPVWVAVTPLAHDLTVHAGKGATSQAARLSAIMEAIERVSAENVVKSRITRHSFTTMTGRLGEQVVDPETLDLPFQSKYHALKPLDWVKGYDIARGQSCFVPLDCVLNPPREGIFIGIETNGLASGNNITEATLHAVYELIERDAEAHARFYDLYGDGTRAQFSAIKMIDIETFPADALNLVRTIEAQGFQVLARNLETDVGIPVFAVYVVNRSFAGAEGQPIAFAGFGADLQPERALMRAITEAVQSHTGSVLGARDTFEEDGVEPERPAMMLRRAALLYPDQLKAFPSTSYASEDLLSDLNTVLARLAQAGLTRCVVVDLTQAELQVPVVRIVIPGLASPFGDSSRRPAVRLLRTLI